MAQDQPREQFDTGINKIREEIKGRLVNHGLYGSVTGVDIGPADVPTGITIELTVKGRTTGRTFDRHQIEDCRLRVGGAVLAAIISMVDELSAASPPG